MKEMNAMTMAVMLSTRLAAIEAPRVAASSRLLGCPPSSLYKQSEREHTVVENVIEVMRKANFCGRKQIQQE